TSIGKASAPKPPVAPIQVGITATAAAWIHLTAAGKTVAQTTLQPGQSASYAVTPPVDLISGNAGGTQVTVNGTPQPALGAAGVIVLWRYPPGTVRILPPAKPAATRTPPAKASPAATKAAPVAKKPAPAKAVGGAPGTGSGQP
ncbi:MAG: RodZ domain-containing protein, partial [Terriglobales bacterium]